ncbi:DUF2634 domain-containing protein [Paenibacillus pini]|uniref:DUF2634 domain-containing protein n=1 Tax=Paenibacillus pini JCM 16418 TaxID=1236976 RepID=W7YGV0_9BACL|nr:DUF2634 domain-containing protein [Paenibacillus pini]GAF06828.1 hypothetical protein JCM16418_810 [Paenibacillus pini JCM 16418]
MQSFKLTEGDIEFDSTGNIVMIDGEQELAQCCEIGIGTNTGEWFLNPGLGITFSLFLGKHLNNEEMRSELTRGLLQEERIKSVEDITFDADERSRVMTVSFKATGISGELIHSEGVTIGAG